METQHPEDQEQSTDAVIPEAPPELAKRGEEQKKLERLAQIRQLVDTTTDRLGHPIEPGIKETVILLNALDFSTTQSCEGHIDWGVGIPWVEVTAPIARDKHGAINRLKTEALAIHNLSRAHTLLKEFYEGKGIDNYDYILRISSRGWGFEVESPLEDLHLAIDQEKREEAMAKLDAERQEFKEFLRQPENRELGGRMEYYHELPEDDDWLDDEGRYGELQRSFLEIRAKTHGLLRQFYATKGVDPNQYDRLLKADGHRIFRIQSNINEMLNLLTVEQRERVLPDYQREMHEFTEFLRQKYMS